MCRVGLNNSAVGCSAVDTKNPQGGLAARSRTTTTPKPGGARYAGARPNPTRTSTRPAAREVPPVLVNTTYSRERATPNVASKRRRYSCTKPEDRDERGARDEDSPQRARTVETGQDPCDEGGVRRDRSAVIYSRTPAGHRILPEASPVSPFAP